MIAEEVEKRYWRVGEVAELIGVEPSAIRFWESALELNGHRNRKGDRRYTAIEIELLQVISVAVKDLHLSTVKRLLKSGKLSEVMGVIGK